MHADLHLRGGEMIEYLKHRGSQGRRQELVTVRKLDTEMEPYARNFRGTLPLVTYFFVYALGTVLYMLMMILAAPFVECAYLWGMQTPSHWIRKRFSNIVVFWSFPSCKYVMIAFFQLTFLATVTYVASTPDKTLISPISGQSVQVMSRAEVRRPLVPNCYSLFPPCSLPGFRATSRCLSCAYEMYAVASKALSLE